MPADKSTASASSKNRKKRVDDSEEEQESQVEVPAPSDPASGEEDEDQEEYEIEEILKAERGRFPNGQLGYFVKWKGFDASENSWVSAQDAGNAKELIDAFWAKKKKNKTPAGPSARTTKVSAKPRKSPSPVDKENDEEEEELPESVSAPAPKKRGRPPKAKSPSPELDGMDVDEEEEPQPKKKPRKEIKETKSAPAPKPSKSAKPQSSKKSKQQSDKAEDEDEDVLGDMDAFSNHKTWEDLIHTVDTVERTEGNELFVYFTLKSKYGSLRVKEKSEVCKQKFPQKLLSFYEANLRWKAADDM